VNNKHLERYETQKKQYGKNYLVFANELLEKT